MILTDNYGKHNGRKDIICCLMGWNIDNIRKEIDDMTNEELTGTTAEELKEAQDYFDEYYNPIPQKKEEKKKVKNNVMLNELFNRLIEQASVIKELEKDNELLRNERKLMVEHIVKVEKEKEVLKSDLEMKDKEIESLKEDVINKMNGIDSLKKDISNLDKFKDDMNEIYEAMKNARESN